VYEPAVYKVLYEQLLLEQSEYERRQIIREKLLSEVAAERHHVKLFQVRFLANSAHRFVGSDVLLISSCSTRSSVGVDVN